MYISTYVRKRGKYYHLIFEIIKYGKKTIKSKSSKTDDKEQALKMLANFSDECINTFGLNIKEKVNTPEKIFKQVNDSCDMFDPNVKFCEFAKNYVMMRYKAISDETYSSYLSVIKNSIIPYFFKIDKKINEINIIDIQKYYYHELNVREVSVNTVIHYHNLLSLIFKYAFKLNLIKKIQFYLLRSQRKINIQVKYIMLMKSKDY